jgi:hypothetical protein
VAVEGLAAAVVEMNVAVAAPVAEDVMVAVAAMEVAVVVTAGYV